MELIDFLQAGRNPHKLKGDWIFLGVGMVKDGCDYFGHRTLKLTVFQKWADGI